MSRSASNRSGGGEVADLAGATRPAPRISTATVDAAHVAHREAPLGAGRRDRDPAARPRSRCSIDAARRARRGSRSARPRRRAAPRAGSAHRPPRRRSAPSSESTATSSAPGRRTPGSPPGSRSADAQPAEPPARRLRASGRPTSRLPASEPARPVEVGRGGRSRRRLDVGVRDERVADLVEQLVIRPDERPQGPRARTERVELRRRQDPSGS